MADLVQAYLLGLLLSLAVELPTNAIWNALLPTGMGILIKKSASLAFMKIVTSVKILFLLSPSRDTL